MKVYIDDMLVKSIRAPHNPFSRGVPGPEKLQYEVKRSQMSFRSLLREVLRFYSQQQRNKGKPR